jgi:hypothetical protein
VNTLSDDICVTESQSFFRQSGIYKTCVFKQIDNSGKPDLPFLKNCSCVEIGRANFCMRFQFFPQNIGSAPAKTADYNHLVIQLYT